MGQKGQVLIFLIVGMLVVAIAGGAFYLGKTFQKTAPTPLTVSQTPRSSVSLAPQSTAVPQPTLVPDETANWKTYTSKDISFKYPSTWTIIDNYSFKENINRENFVLKCSGPILQDTKNKTTLIAVESINIKERPDGGFCWSTGSFKSISKRTIATVVPSKAVSVSQWIPGVLLKVTENEKASLIFQTYDFNEFSKVDPTKNWYEFALIFEEGKDSLAEQTFDQILSTFKILDQTNAEEKACGGLAGEQWQFACPAGYKCKYPEPMYPDARGKCVKL